ncbi:hypothetical protein LC065_13405 [Halobacillus litoralis]|uniref:hypothetical protein n=1 Tax=Halobacillus litoralis TaxID=45668 RepID=UPI001CFC657C|nr:hypothetical protein [Halobacillus litoralis]WLR46564.1 hypothetical protein LC065_13405 [Halobacillus litoralis]
MKTLLKNHKEYYVNKVLKVQAKTINKDRIMINLLPLLKFNGKTQSPLVNNVDELLEYVWNNELLFDGFSDHKELVEKWLKNDYMDMLHKESEKKESKFVSLLPLSLNAYKASNTKNRDDYGGSEELWHLLYKADEERKVQNQDLIIQKLTDFLSNGYNRELDQVENDDQQDLSTWLISSITNQLSNDQDNDKERIHSEDPLLCMTQARLLADDIERLLAYQHVMSRTALIESLSQVMMLHIGLYVLRAAQMLPVMVKKKTMNIDCGCSRTNKLTDMNACKYQPFFQMDMMQNYSSHLSKISRRNIEIHEQQLSLFVESMFYIRKKLDFLEYLDDDKNYSLEEVLQFDLSTEKLKVENYFKVRFDGLKEFVDDVEKDPEEDYFTNYVAVINREYNKYYVAFFKRLISSAFSKNDERGILRQAGSHKKYTIGSQLLDTIIHLAMVEKKGYSFETKVLRLDQFLNWIRDRYGFYVDDIIPGYESSQAFHSLRQSKNYFTTKLQEIGYYQALSDAYNTQWLIARYDVKGGKRDATAGKATS